MTDNERRREDISGSGGTVRNISPSFGRVSLLRSALLPVQVGILNIKRKEGTRESAGEYISAVVNKLLDKNTGRML